MMYSNATNRNINGAAQTIISGASFSNDVILLKSIFSEPKSEGIVLKLSR